jgi:hypothetical protein
MIKGNPARLWNETFEPFTAVYLRHEPHIVRQMKVKQSQLKIGVVETEEANIPTPPICTSFENTTSRAKFKCIPGATTTLRREPIDTTTLLKFTILGIETILPAVASVPFHFLDPGL